MFAAGELNADSGPSRRAGDFGRALHLRGDLDGLGPRRAVIVAVLEQRPAHARAIETGLGFVFIETLRVTLIHQQHATGLAHDDGGRVAERVRAVLVDKLERAPGLPAIGAALHHDVVLRVIAKAGAAFGEGEQ